YKDIFNIIVIDGRDRVNCAKNSLKALKGDGVIIWDNSEREYYQEGYSYLIQNGFRRLDFEGLGPIGIREWCTSIFYRDNNCFEI
ncbi:MAG TPA: FkbM family methyltransferase, partial [Desulfobacteraceae bacterium]|nr:FkbM family methyltransferase [Desulfobacteraceae bacterium]